MSLPDWITLALCLATAAMTARSAHHARRAQRAVDQLRQRDEHSD